ncbi:MAG: Gfo/Idh/MocA family oxidoreductase [Lutibacter sp.]|nr:Gfo/Idh/MocA family oxidoreductase [Lutibacter sp.]
MKKVLVVGYGSIGKRHVNNLLTFPNIKILVYTKRKDVKHLKNERLLFSNSLKSCLQENPTMGFVANETSNHIKTATILAQNGINIFLEKPLSNSMKGVNNLLKIVNRKKLITLMGCNFRFYPPIMKIKKNIEENKIGRIISVQVENGSYLPDWHPDEDFSKGYAAKKNLGGGVILTQIHEIDYLYWFFGKIDHISSISGKYSDLELDVEDISVSILKFKNKILGELHVDFLQRPQFKRCKIRGVKGIIEWNSDENVVKKFNIKDQRWEIIPIKNNYKLTSKKKINSMYIEEIKHFLKCVKNQTETINPLTQGIETLKIALRIKKS